MGYIFWLNGQATSKEVIFVYFLVQALGSGALFLFFFILPQNLSIGQRICTFSLLIKLGFPPIHRWFLWVRKNLDFFRLIILCTLQKILPALILIQLVQPGHVFFLVVLGVSLGVWGLLKESRIKIIIAFSSIVRTCWVFLTREKVPLLIFYFATISLGLIVLARNFCKNRETRERGLQRISLIRWKHAIFLRTILTVSGLPPRVTFIAKIQISLTALARSDFTLVPILLIGRFAVFYSLARVLSSLSLRSKQSLLLTPKHTYGARIVLLNLIRIWIFL